MVRWYGTVQAWTLQLQDISQSVLRVRLAPLAVSEIFSKKISQIQCN